MFLTKCLRGEPERRKVVTKLDIGGPSNFVHVSSSSPTLRFQDYGKLSGVSIGQSSDAITDQSIVSIPVATTAGVVREL